MKNRFQKEVINKVKKELIESRIKIQGMKIYKNEINN